MHVQSLDSKTIVLFWQSNMSIEEIPFKKKLINFLGLTKPLTSWNFILHTFLVFGEILPPLSGPGRTNIFQYWISCLFIIRFFFSFCFATVFFTWVRVKLQRLGGNTQPDAACPLTPPDYWKPWLTRGHRGRATSYAYHTGTVHCLS